MKEKIFCQSSDSSGVVQGKCSDIRELRTIQEKDDRSFLFNLFHLLNSLIREALNGANTLSSCSCSNFAKDHMTKKTRSTNTFLS